MKNESSRITIIMVVASIATWYFWDDGKNLAWFIYFIIMFVVHISFRIDDIEKSKNKSDGEIKQKLEELNKNMNSALWYLEKLSKLHGTNKEDSRYYSGDDGY